MSSPTSHRWGAVNTGGSEEEEVSRRQVQGRENDCCGGMSSGLASVAGCGRHRTRTSHFSNEPLCSSVVSCSPCAPTATIPRSNVGDSSDSRVPSTILRAGRVQVSRRSAYCGPKMPPGPTVISLTVFCYPTAPRGLARLPRSVSKSSPPKIDDFGHVLR